MDVLRVCETLLNNYIELVLQAHLGSEDESYQCSNFCLSPIFSVILFTLKKVVYIDYTANVDMRLFFQNVCWHSEADISLDGNWSTSQRENYQRSLLFRRIVHCLPAICIYIFFFYISTKLNASSTSRMFALLPRPDFESCNLIFKFARCLHNIYSVRRVNFGVSHVKVTQDTQTAVTS